MSWDKPKYRISKSHPIPETVGQGRKPDYPFATMEVGDSIHGSQSMTQAARVYKSRHPGWDCTSRREGDGWRLWRIK